MKTFIPLVAAFATQAFACITFEGGIQIGGINKGMWINKFDEDKRQPCKGSIKSGPDGWFNVGCEAGYTLRVSPDGKKVKYSNGKQNREWNQPVDISGGDQVGACGDRRGACITLGKQHQWNVKRYC